MIQKLLKCGILVVAVSLFVCIMPTSVMAQDWEDDWPWFWDDWYDDDYDDDYQDWTDPDPTFVPNPVLEQTELQLNLSDGYKSSWGETNGYYVCSNNTVTVTGVKSFCGMDIKVKNEAGKVSNKVYTSVNWWDYSEKCNISVYPKKVGNYTLELTVNGQTYNCLIKVFNYTFERNAKTVGDNKSKEWSPYSSMLSLYTGESTTLKVEGAPGKIKWSSSNPSIVTVNQKGKVTAKGMGYAFVEARSGDFVIRYQVGVSSKKATLALRECYKLYGTLTYSQEKRMSDGYADCSSFVWKGYKKAGMALGSSSYALTAAGLSDWCKDKGYRIYYGKATIANLLPGDLVFYCGADNGRSDGIYHVDMYVGNGIAVTVDREKWLWDEEYNVIIARPCISTTSNVKAQAVEDCKIQLSWKSCYGVDGYEIYQSTSEKGTYKKVGTVTGYENTSFVSKKLASKGTYYYKIRPFWESDGKKYYATYSAVAHAKAE